MIAERSGVVSGCDMSQCSETVDDTPFCQVFVQCKLRKGAADEHGIGWARLDKSNHIRAPTCSKSAELQILYDSRVRSNSLI